jgi:UDP:flavonoid glycosyltransferase YjiC (YdhE family)
MKILFASVPADGHFNPLTGLAVYLREKGHDVRWYTGPSYAKKLAQLGVPHFPFERATDVNGENIAERFPEYASLGVGPKAIAFALEKVFFGNLEAHLRDITALYAGFPFEAIVYDGAFYAGRLVSEKLGVAAYPIWPGPTPAPTSKEAPPPFFGLKPARSPFGKLRDRIVWMMLASSMKGGMRIWTELRAREGLPPFRGSLMDVHNDTSRMMFMIGAPGLDFPRSDWPKNMRFVGALMPHKKAGGALPRALADKIARYAGRVVVVSQGTIDNRDPNKLFVPSLEALSRGEKLVVVTTGGLHTEELRKRFPNENVVVEDWISFDVLLPHAALFICNGGYGSVIQALANGVPLLVAGKLEAKNDINARLDYRGFAIDLRTEHPTARQIARGVARVLGEPRYRENVARLRAELSTYDPFGIIERELAHDARGRSEASAPRAS